MIDKIKIVYMVICVVYYVFAIVFTFTAKKKMLKKSMVILTVVMTMLLIGYTVCYFCIDTGGKEIGYFADYFDMFGTGFPAILVPLALFIWKNSMLNVKDGMNNFSSEQKEKIAMLVGYETMLKEKMITQEEYDQKKREIFGDDEKKESDVADA